MGGMFRHAVSFCQDLSKWTGGKEFKNVFIGAKSFQKIYDPINLKKIIKSDLSSQDKKIITKLKKLFNSRDYTNIDSGIEILRTLNQSNLYNFFLTGIELDGEGCLIRSKIFLGNRNSQPYLDYILILLINYAKDDCLTDKSIKRENIKKINLQAATFDYNRVNGNNYELEDCGKFTTYNFPKLDFPNLEIITLGNYQNLESVDFLIDCKSLKKVDISSSLNEINKNVLSHIEGLEFI